ncbi:hypothetical protein EUGRSUZ_B00791, partial [Eucalyptus grandis]
MNFQSFICRASCHRLALVVIFTSLVYKAASKDVQYNACLPRTCEYGPDINYPFWISGKQESYCGYPNFEITCVGMFPFLNFSDSEFIIKDIFYGNHSLLLFDTLVYLDTCGAPLRNISLESTPFILSSTNADFFFYYNCTSPPPDFTYLMDCASNSTHHSFAFFHKEVLQEMNSVISTCNSALRACMLRSCSDLAAVVSGDSQRSCGDGSQQSAVRDVLVNVNVNIASLANYNEIMEMGFLLNWTAINAATAKKVGDDAGSRTIMSSAFARTVLILKPTMMKKPMIRRIMALIKQMSEYFDGEMKIKGLVYSRRYTYEDIKRMTNSFKEKLGQGGYGCVYKGKLQDGQLVAVKLLKKLKGDAEEFFNEVASISRTSHVNVVNLLGFYFEGSKRALVYEFLPDGSLEKFIFNRRNTLELEQLLTHGLEYLHRGCNTRILHFDIKPHNILLDTNYCPKISDFGLAKICPRQESIVSMLGARGTPRCIAPKLFMKNIEGVSHKPDVYSYDMMILEMVGRSKNIEVMVDRTSETYFPHWVHQCLELREELGLHGIMNEGDEEIVKNMIVIGLWCIHINPRARPCMTQVVEMLKGSVEALQIPPKPSLSSPSILLEACP